jgi:aryl-alcohol dehydrogenase-like predicted oxidoreductase
MAQLALAWVLQNRNVSAAIIGASTTDQLKHNAAAVGVEIPADAMTKIADIFSAVAVFDPSETKSPPARLT